MPLSKHLIGVMVATFLVSFAAQAQNAISEFRAFWADAWHEGFQSLAEVSNLVSSVRAANCNALFVQVRKRGDAYYAGSPYEPASGAGKGSTHSLVHFGLTAV